MASYHVDGIITDCVSNTCLSLHPLIYSPQIQMPFDGGPNGKACMLVPDIRRIES